MCLQANLQVGHFDGVVSRDQGSIAETVGIFFILSHLYGSRALATFSEQQFSH